MTSFEIFQVLVLFSSGVKQFSFRTHNYDLAEIRHFRVYEMYNWFRDRLLQ